MASLLPRALSMGTSLSARPGVAVKGGVRSSRSKKVVFFSAVLSKPSARGQVINENMQRFSSEV